MLKFLSTNTKFPTVEHLGMYPFKTFSKYIYIYQLVLPASETCVALNLHILCPGLQYWIHLSHSIYYGTSG